MWSCPPGAVEAGAEALGCCTVFSSLTLHAPRAAKSEGNKRKTSHRQAPLPMVPGQRQAATRVARNRMPGLGVKVLMSTEPPPSETPLNGRKILIVEDEAPIVLNLAAAVQQAGGIVTARRLGGG